MNRRYVTQPLYDTTPAGVLIPSGSTSYAQSLTKSTVFATKIKSKKLVALFLSHGLDIEQSPSLKTLMVETSILSDAILLADDQKSTYPRIFCALQLQRVIESVETIETEPNIKLFLKLLLDGSLDLLVRKRSRAKDTLWELEFLRVLHNNGITATIGEPDIVTTGATPLGIACKKLYSEGGVSKVLSEAVFQIGTTGLPGIVALNIDDLLPENSILQTKTIDDAIHTLNEHISVFMQNHERHMRRYLEPARTIAVMVSCACLGDLIGNTPRFCNLRQTVAWHIPHVSPTVEAQFNTILSAFIPGTRQSPE